MSKGFIQETIPYSGRSRATELGLIDLAELAAQELQRRSEIDAMQSHAGKTASQAADGFCKQMITEALAGLDVAVQAHLLTSALLGLEGDGALGAQIVARERLAQHVTRAITLRPERR